MHEYLTRVRQLAQKLRQIVMPALRVCGHTLAMAGDRVANLVRHYAPIIRQYLKIRAGEAWQCTLRLCRIGLDHALRFTHRAIIMAHSLGIRIVERLRHYTPILREFILKVSREGFDQVLRFARRVVFTAHALGTRIVELLLHYTPIFREFILKISREGIYQMLRFARRVVFMGHALGTRIAEQLRYYIPIAGQFLKGNAVKAWCCALRFCQVNLKRTATNLRRMAVLVAAFWQKTFALLHNYTPILLHDLGIRLQNAWRTAGGLCHFLLQHAVDIARTTARVIFNAGVLSTRYLYGLTRRLALVFTAFSRQTMAGLRHYLPIILRATSNGMQVTGHALVTSGRLCLRWAGRMVRAISGMVLGFLAQAATISRKLLLAGKNLSLLVAQALITFCRVAGHYLGQGSRRLSHSIWIIAVRYGERLYQYALLTRLNKPVGIFLLLWPTLWALWIAAEGAPDLPILLIFISGVVLMRSAGCVINDLADREFDANISRTRQRPLATGKVTSKEALVITGVLILCAFLLVLQLNRLTIGLSVVGVLLAIIYPFTKRYTYMPQFFLGLAFGWAVPMAFAAQTGTVPAIGWILLMAAVLWALVYDTMYAMADRNEDIKLGIKSTAILFEDADRIIIGIIQLLVVLTLLLIGNRLGFNRNYYAGLAIAALLFIYQQHLIRDRLPEHCLQAFQNNKWFGAMVFVGILMNYQYG